MASPNNLTTQMIMSDGGGTGSFDSGGSGGVGGWTFIADSNNQLALSDALTTAANDFDSKKSEMYGHIDNMGNFWKGDDYDLFNSSAHNYNNALQSFSDSIRMFSSQFGSLSGATEQLSSELISIIMNMTGSADSGGAGGSNGLDGINGANGLGDPNVTGTEGSETTSGFTNWFKNNSYWQNIGADYAENYDFSNANNPFDYAWEAVGGTINLGIDLAQTAGNAVFDSANWLLDAAQWILNGHWGGYEGTEVSSNDPATISNPYDNAYWKNLGNDFVENYDFSKADNVFDYAWEAVGGTVETVYDGAMVVVNGVVDTAQGVVEVAEWAWNGILDWFS